MAQFLCSSPAHTPVHRFKSIKDQPSLSIAEIMKEFAAREKRLKEFQQVAERRGWELHRLQNSSILLTDREKLGEEDGEDVRAKDNFMFREMHLIRVAEHSGEEMRGRLKMFHGGLHKESQEKKISLTADDCPYCLETNESRTGIDVWKVTVSI